MGHRKTRAPRHGSLAYFPKKRAKHQKGMIRTWPTSDKACFEGFAGFKAGMTHVALIEKHDTSPYKDQEIFSPVTIIEAPPLYMYGIRLYKKTEDGLKTVGDLLASNISKKPNMSRRISMPREIKDNEMLKKFKQTISKEKVTEIRGLFASQPYLISIPSKIPNLFEIKVSGKDSKEALTFAEKYLGKEIRVWDVLKEGQFIDVAAVTKGKGFQGPVKRFRIHRLQHKSRKAVRAVACIGPWHPARVMWTVPRAGQMGYHQRIEYNKQIIKISENGEEVTPAGGFVNYGVVKGDYIMVRGSIPGPKKRLVRIRPSLRKQPDIEIPEITYVN
ncbi:50S ribosomal protein L3, partial [Candidatus Bathyarchaeota archaeon]|nr:50S ribosomal protein L3 [Candidatus Bathyarchaeota archaeon]